MEISSDTVIEDIDKHFRVRAGPGAGKTYWLVSHIKNVLRKSTRLGPSSRIGCISYTNVAVTEIRNQLGCCAERVDASTIHSFLYRNVVKPYLHLVQNDDGDAIVKYADVEGHDEHRPRYNHVDNWIKLVSIRKLRGFFHENQLQLFKELKRIAWQLQDGAGAWVVRNTRFSSLQNLSSAQIQRYKETYWQDPIIDHEDVLYFAYRILDEHPYIHAFLSARFPYLFIDEFQDTNPVQTQVVKWLAESGTVVGVIGDSEQSIFAFQGANRKDFLDFAVSGMREYTILRNRRSADRIIDLLNNVRGDGLKQVGHRKILGEPVRVIVGDATTVLQTAQKSLPTGEILHVLAWKNDHVFDLRRQKCGEVSDYWQEFASVDSRRARFFYRLITATEAARLGNIPLAMQEIMRALWRRKGDAREPLKCKNGVLGIQRRGISLSVLEVLMTEYECVRNSTVFESYDRVNRALKAMKLGLSLIGVKKGGGFAAFADVTELSELADAVRLSDETRTVRTIHNAKAAQFKNVLICLQCEGKGPRLDHLLSPTVSEDEESRITYVALSRAEDRLFISVPQLPAQQERQLRLLGLEVDRID